MKKRILILLSLLISLNLFAQEEVPSIDVFCFRFGMDNEEITMTIETEEDYKCIFFIDTYISEAVFLFYDFSEDYEFSKLAFECKQLASKYKYQSDYEENEISQKIISKLRADRVTEENYDVIPGYGYSKITFVYSAKATED